MQIFARLMKVDEQSGIVYGRAVQEVEDRSGEVFDYATSKPYFEHWSSDIAKATDGKSVGNVRAMHGKVAAGKLTEINFNDSDLAIDVAAKIVDPVERQKCLEGVYTGFSIGGSYVKKWADGALTRYTANPVEVSLVDMPCVPTAQFTVVKSDGTQELRKFDQNHQPAGPGGGEFAPDADTKKMTAKEHRTAALDHENMATREERLGHEKAATAHRSAADAHEYAAMLKTKHDPNADWKSHKAQWLTQEANNESNEAGSYHNPVELGAHKAMDTNDLSKTAKRDDVDPKEGEHKYGDVKFADEKNKKYPIDTAAHIRAAWNYIHKPKNAGEYSAEDVKAIKAKIVAAWKEKIDPKGPPSAAKKYSAAKLEKNAAAIALAQSAQALLGEPVLEKGLFAVSQFAQLLEQLCAICDCAQFEADIEGDNSPVPKELAAALKPVAEAFLAMAEEETHEALGTQPGQETTVETSAKTDGLEKRGAKHSAETKAHHAAIRKAHEEIGKHLDALEGDDPGEHGDDDEGAEKLAKMTAERDVLLKRLADLGEILLRILAQPAPAKGVVMAVEKTVGGAETGKQLDIEPVKKADGTIDGLATAEKLMKAAYKQPMQFTR